KSEKQASDFFADVRDDVDTRGADGSVRPKNIECQPDRGARGHRDENPVVQFQSLHSRRGSMVRVMTPCRPAIEKAALGAR
ncbi:MAG: hypothetical protein ACI9KE_003339, partial [Polyangiales bacterium]